MFNERWKPSFSTEQTRNPPSPSTQEPQGGVCYRPAVCERKVRNGHRTAVGNQTRHRSAPPSCPLSAPSQFGLVTSQRGGGEGEQQTHSSAHWAYRCYGGWRVWRGPLLWPVSVAEGGWVWPLLLLSLSDTPVTTQPEEGGLLKGFLTSPRKVERAV